MKKYKIKEVQEMFSIARGTVYNWNKDGRLEILKEGKKTYIKLGKELRDELKKINERKEKPKKESVETEMLKTNLATYKNKYLASTGKVEELEKKTNKKEEKIKELERTIEELRIKEKETEKKLDDLSTSLIEVLKVVNKIDGNVEEIIKVINSAKKGNNSGILKKFFN